MINDENISANQFNAKSLGSKPKSTKSSKTIEET